jgi:RNA polymerase sigma-70 factor (ECF subfamily)
MDVEYLKSCLERYHQESYGWARFCCRRDADEAENVLQTVYLKILEQRAVFKGKASFRTWLFGVIRVTASEFRRRRVLQRLQIIRYNGVKQQQPPAAGADDTLYGAQLESGIRKALAAMPRRQAEVLQLVFYHDLSLPEAAEAIGVSLGSARTHYERGKKRLRILLEGSAWNDRRRF